MRKILQSSINIFSLRIFKCVYDRLNWLWFCLMWRPDDYAYFQWIYSRGNVGYSKHKRSWYGGISLLWIIGPYELRLQTVIWNNEEDIYFPEGAMFFLSHVSLGHSFPIYSYGFYSMDIRIWTYLNDNDMDTISCRSIYFLAKGKKERYIKKGTIHKYWIGVSF